MTSRAWPVVSIVALGWLGACAGKSRTTRGLDTGSSEAGQGTGGSEAGAGATNASGGGATSGGGGGAPANGGTGATHESGGGGAATNGGAGGSPAGENGGAPAIGSGASGSFAGSGATGARDGMRPGAASASPECVAYHAKSLADACSELVTCAATLAEYMDALRAKGVSDWASARQGCGLIEITPWLPDEPETLLTFDAEGHLVGYWVTEPDPTAPCDDYEYVRGTQFILGCGAAFCKLEPSATSADDLCTCLCPDPPPPDGIVIAPRRCVVSIGPPNDCRPTAEEEQQVGSPLLDLKPPTWTRECGRDVADLFGMQCVYDAAEPPEGIYKIGPLLGVRSNSHSCPGVTVWMTEGTPPPCTTP